MYLYADYGIQEMGDPYGNPKKNWFQSILSLYERIFSKEGGYTEAGDSIYKLLGERLVPTLHLTIFSMAIGILGGVVLGLHSSQYPLLAKVGNGLSKFILSTPIFVFAVVFLLVFFYKWELLPPSGYVSGNILYLIMPGTCLGMRVFARLYLYTYKSTEELFQNPYYLILQTRGLSESFILYKNVLLHISPTLLILIALDTGSLLGGAMVVEEIFSYPGIGRAMLTGIRNMDSHLLEILILYSGIAAYVVNRIAYLLQRKITSVSRTR